MHILRPDTIPADTTRLRVLVVEDDREMQTFLCDVLRGHGYEPHAAANDAEAFLALREAPMDAILLDKNLPELSGLEILPGIRRLFPDIPVILVSAFGDVTTAAQARERGATAYLPKPFRMAEVLQILAREGEAAALRRRVEK